jgi:hypothetical protein
VILFAPELEQFERLNCRLLNRGHHRIFAIGEHLLTIDRSSVYRIDRSQNQFSRNGHGDSWLFGTPTYYNGKVFFLTGQGQLVSFDIIDKKYSTEIGNFLNAAN